MSARKGFWMAVGCAGIIGLLAFGGVILQSGGFLTLAADFNEQQLPFSVAAWKGVRSGSPWLWGVDLGSSLITTFSFYNLGSPFFWLTLPFPVDSFPRLAGFLFILKYMTAAGSGYVYLRRFCGTPAAVTGALIYAFSGFQATNLMFSHFHDVVAFFPLLLTGLEDHLRENGNARDRPMPAWQRRSPRYSWPSSPPSARCFRRTSRPPTRRTICRTPWWACAT